MGGGRRAVLHTPEVIVGTERDVSRVVERARGVTWALAGVSLVAGFAACGSPTQPAQNATPSVTVTFQGSSTCAPQSGRPCTLDIVAQASDPDGDPLQYVWSGCATGTSARATCTVERVGAVVASVVVSDGHGHNVTGTISGEGTTGPNAAPTVTVALEGPSWCTPVGSRTCTLTVVAQANDSDGDPLQYVWSGCASGTSARAVCTVGRLGPVVASVEVTDDHGHAATGSVAGEGNAPPDVTVVFQGPSVCTPQPGKPCTLDVLAQASDLDGDPLKYDWSGCAGGTAARATCVVERPGPVTASVAVTDDHAHTASSGVSGTGAGTNHPPGVQIGGIWVSPTGRGFELLGYVDDPDESLCGREYCVSATASGACGSAHLECTCLAGLDAFVSRTAASGVCTVTFTVKDSWGQVGTPSFSFDVNNPKPLTVSSGGAISSTPMPSGGQR
jgi:hypothetical protein